MVKCYFVDPEVMTITVRDLENPAFLEQMREFVEDPGHTVIPVHGQPRVTICGNFHHDWGLYKFRYGISIAGFPSPIMGKCVFYAEDIQSGKLIDYPTTLKSGENVRWITREPGEPSLDRPIMMRTPNGE